MKCHAKPAELTLLTPRAHSGLRRTPRLVGVLPQNSDSICTFQHILMHSLLNFAQHRTVLDGNSDDLQVDRLHLLLACPVLAWLLLVFLSHACVDHTARIQHFNPYKFVANHSHTSVTHVRISSEHERGP
jgi:uncharacterized membrane protein